MLHRSVARYASIFGGGSAAARGAAEDWFGKTKSVDTWRGSFISLLLCLCGIGVINQFTRGNVMGRAEYEDQIVTPFQNRKVPPPETYGFVDAEAEAAEAKPSVRRA